jgi:hypothetical protein
MIHGLTTRTSWNVLSNGCSRECCADAFVVISGLWHLKKRAKIKELSGIIYFHDITQARIEPARENLEMLNDLSRSDVAKNVVFSTTKWGAIREEVGERRQRELSETFWTTSNICSFKGTESSAWQIINLVLGMEPIDVRLFLRDVERVGARIPKARASGSKGFFSFLFRLVTIQSNTSELAY